MSLWIESGEATDYEKQQREQGEKSHESPAKLEGSAILAVIDHPAHPANQRERGCQEFETKQEPSEVGGKMNRGGVHLQLMAFRSGLASTVCVFLCGNIAIKPVL